MDDQNKNNSKWYYLVFALIVLICVVVIVTSLLANKNEDKEEINLAYTDLIKKIDNQDVEKIEMTVRKYINKSKIKKCRRRKTSNCSKYSSIYRISTRTSKKWK